jgi:hypothetical protein
VRQWLLMFVKPSSIAHVDVTAAERAFPKVLGFAQSWTGDLPADDGPARKWPPTEWSRQFEMLRIS